MRDYVRSKVETARYLLLILDEAFGAYGIAPIYSMFDVVQRPPSVANCAIEGGRWNPLQTAFQNVSPSDDTFTNLDVKSDILDGCGLDLGASKYACGCCSPTSDALAGSQRTA